MATIFVMPEAETEWSAEDVAKGLRRRRRFIGVFQVGCILIAGSILLNHVRGNSVADDWAGFDGKQFAFASAIDGDSILLRSCDVPVKLLGVESVDGTFDKKAADHEILGGQTVTLKLDPTQTRDSRGRLLAYVYLGDRDMINVDLAADGLAKADWSVPCTFHGDIGRAQSEAKRKHLGIWSLGE
jgi:hypothetical protein